jgi:hypothetical protein
MKLITLSVLLLFGIPLVASNRGLALSEVASQSPGSQAQSRILGIPEETTPCVADPGTIFAIVSAAKTLFAEKIDLREFAKNLHYVAQGNIWPMWTCQYADGTVVYNKFRWYRDGAAVTRYFVGQPDSHDCDAYVMAGGRKYRWCTQNAASFARQHGGIVCIRPIE